MLSHNVGVFSTSAVKCITVFEVYARLWQATIHVFALVNVHVFCAACVCSQVLTFKFLALWLHKHHLCHCLYKPYTQQINNGMHGVYNHRIRALKSKYLLFKIKIPLEHTQAHEYCWLVQKHVNKIIVACHNLANTSNMCYPFIADTDNIVTKFMPIHRY